MNNPVCIEREGQIGIVITDNPPVNALSTAVRAGLMEAVETLDSDPEIKAIILHCEGRTFHAGADIREFNQPPAEPYLGAVIDRIEACSKPVIAALHGTALGGGFEVALGAHYRVMHETGKVGLPEVKLGLLPGAGGTQRLPRLIGPRAALKLIVSGDPIPASKALEDGIADEIASGDILDAAKALAGRLIDEGTPPRRVSQIDKKLVAAHGDLEGFDDFAAGLLARKRGFDSPRICVESVRNAITLPFVEGAKKEREFFLELKDGHQSAAQRHLFFAEREALKVEGVERDTPVVEVKQAAVLGSGTMGGGIAMCFADAGISVKLIDPNAEALQRGLGLIEKNYQRSAARSGKGDGWVGERMDRITPASSMEAAAEADLVVEAVFEDMALKKEIFGELDRITKADAVLATNTSTLDVNDIATAVSDPGRVVGMHFFSPANVMRLLEVVRGEKTDSRALKTAIETGRKLRKLPVTVGVCYGFVGNRMLYARTMQVEALMLEGALPHEIDKALTDFGFAMGPCAVGDLAGLDVGWRARKQAGRTAPVADAICELGRFGQKTGKGYYLYEEGSRRGAPDPEIEALIRSIAKKMGVEQRQITPEEIFERLIYAMINEGARILEEGIASRSSDIDLIWVNGYGWPAYEGGPMFHADLVGAGRITERLDHYADMASDETLKPAPLLRRLAKTGSRFSGF